MMIGLPECSKRRYGEVCHVMCNNLNFCTMLTMQVRDLPTLTSQLMMFIYLEWLAWLCWMIPPPMEAFSRVKQTVSLWISSLGHFSQENNYLFTGTWTLLVWLVAQQHIRSRYVHEAIHHSLSFILWYNWYLFHHHKPLCYLIWYREM